MAVPKKAHGAQQATPGTEITYETVTLTPTIAAEWLRNNHSNRPVRKRRLAQFIADMVAGVFLNTGQPIIFSKSGRMLNGQHRCLGVVKANVSIEVTVVRGVEDFAFACMDDGAPRTLADVLIEEGWNSWEAKTGATATRYCIAYEAGIKLNTAFANHKGREYVFDHPELMDSIALLGQMPRRSAPVPHSLGAFLHYEMRRILGHDDEIAEQFMRQFYTGENLPAGNVVLDLRNTLLARKHKPVEQCASGIIRVWNSVRRDKPIKHIGNAFRSDGTFPRIE